jgi:dephospho-CoA kinase
MKLALSGLTCSGRSIISEYLKSNYNYQIVDLDEPLNKICSVHPHRVWVIMPYISDLFPDIPKKDLIEIQCGIFEIFNKVQPVLTHNSILLTEVENYLRDIDSFLFYNWAQRKTSQDDVVFDNLRFLNDFESFKNDGTQIIRVNISSNVRSERVLQSYGVEDVRALSSSREHMLDNMSFAGSINGDLPVAEVFKQVDRLLEVLSGGTRVHSKNAV